jgi:hypothetical protein
MSDTPSADEFVRGMADDCLDMAEREELLQDFAKNLERELAAMTAERDVAFKMSRCECGTEECCANLVRIQKECAELRKDAERYRTARQMNPRMWKEACMLNLSSGKPFDEIIDDLKPFFGAAMGEKP